MVYLPVIPISILMNIIPNNEEKKNLNLEEIIKDFSIDINGIETWFKNNQIKTLGIQFPEGLKRLGFDIIQFFQDGYNLNVVLLGDPCFGACDIPIFDGRYLEVDGLLHFGHAEIPNCDQGKVPIQYVELISKVNPAPLIKQEQNKKLLLREIPTGSALGLLANLQYIPYIDPVKKELERLNYQVYIGTGDSRIKHPGQVLGCNFSAARSVQNTVSGFLFIGDGIFHPLGVSLATNKLVIAINPINNSCQNISELRNKLLRQRNGAIARCNKCESFGIIVSIKPGQNRLGYAKKIMAKLQKNNKQGIILVMDNITPEHLDYLPFEAYINTACPRLTVDDYLMYKKPILTPIELEILLGERDWEEYIIDEIL